MLSPTVLTISAHPDETVHLPIPFRSDMPASRLAV
jgi:hypothetical protein